MDARRQLAVFLLACSLLTCCLCAPPPRAGRQKRGLMKMMMHIVWDPVRLIRYWHVYDVSKEIAKSWRKILPTVLLLPVTDNNPRAYPGIAKYVHPTNGFRGEKKKGSNYPKAAAGSVRPPVVLPPQALHPALFPHYALASDMMRHHHALTKHAADQHHGGVGYGAAPVVVGEVPYGEGDDRRTVAHYYLKDGNLLGQETSPSFGESVHPHYANSLDVYRPASSQRVNERAKAGPAYVLPSTKHIHYVPQLMESEEMASVHDDSEKRGRPLMVLQPGQEFRVVLHPIPVGEFDPDVLTPPPGDDGRGFRYVPVRSESSHHDDSPSSPVLFKAVAAADDDDEDRYLRNHRHFVEDGAAREIDRSGNGAGIRKGASSSSRKKEHAGTWVVPKKASSGKTMKGPGDADLSADGSAKKVLSIRKFSGLKEEAGRNASDGGSSKVRKTFGLHRFNIDMEQLREDLKHGTPVLIPFNKNGQSASTLTGDADGAGQSRAPHQPSITTTPVPPATDHAEKENDHPSNQRLLLFLKQNDS